VTVPSQCGHNSPFTKVVGEGQEIEKTALGDLVRIIFLSTCPCLGIIRCSCLLIYLFSGSFAFSLADFRVSADTKGFEPEGRCSEIMKKFVVVD
jgi:hypothetical protein